MEELITTGAFKIYGSFATVIMVLISWLRNEIKERTKLTDKLIEFADKSSHAFEAYNKYVTKKGMKDE